MFITNRKLAILIAILAIAFFAVGAVAHATTYPGQRPLQDPVVDASLTWATQYWAARGYTGCATGRTVYVADALYDVDGDAIARATLDDCTIWLDNSWLRGNETDAANATWTIDAVYAISDICRVVTHETGHTLGLQHTRRGVMNPSSDRWHGCDRFARRYVRHATPPHLAHAVAARHAHAIVARRERLAASNARRAAHSRRLADRRQAHTSR